jgi:hypothetical protein
MQAACVLPDCTVYPLDRFVNYTYCKKITQQVGWLGVPRTVGYHMCPMNQPTIFVVAIYHTG